MKVLWITNIVFPAADSFLSGSVPVPGSGGWLTSLAVALKYEVQLAIAAPSARVKELKIFEIDGLKYFVFPLGKGNIKYNSSYEQVWQAIQKEFKPDIVHLHGTEYSHGLAYLRTCGSDNVVVSIQGVMSEIAKHYNDGLSIKDIVTHITPRDLVRHTLFGEKRLALQRAQSEIEILSRVKYVIGRTDFDHAHVLKQNPRVEYINCDEILRDEFYDGMWEYSKCTPHSVFLSSARYPLKGAHMLLKALPIIKKQYPDIQVRIAGSDLSLDCTYRTLRSMSGYQFILSSLIRNLKLEENVLFLGSLAAEEMKMEMLSTNVFLSPSSNENSSNSIGEAQLLGVPCLASYVGGTPDMIPSSQCGALYNYYDTNVLAYKICKMFEDSKTFDNKEMRQHAVKRHNKEQIVKNVVEIYNTMCNKF